MRRERLYLATPMLILLGTVCAGAARGQVQQESNLPSPRLLTVSPCGGKAGTTVEIDTKSTLRVRDNRPVSSSSQRNIRLKVTQP